jgi:hypothetical protein
MGVIAAQNYKTISFWRIVFVLLLLFMSKAEISGMGSFSGRHAGMNPGIS